MDGKLHEEVVTEIKEEKKINIIVKPIDRSFHLEFKMPSKIRYTSIQQCIAQNRFFLRKASRIG